MDNFSFYNDERFSCPGEHAIALLNQKLRCGQISQAEHEQAIRALGDDEALLDRMSAYERMDEMDCRPPGRKTGVDTPAFRAVLERIAAVRADVANRSAAL